MSLELSNFSYVFFIKFFPLLNSFCCSASVLGANLLISPRTPRSTSLASSKYIPLFIFLFSKALAYSPSITVDSVSASADPFITPLTPIASITFLALLWDLKTNSKAFGNVAMALFHFLLNHELLRRVLIPSFFIWRISTSPVYWLKIACIPPVDWFISKLTIESIISIFLAVSVIKFKFIFKNPLSVFLSCLFKLAYSLLALIFILAFWKALLRALSIAICLFFKNFSFSVTVITFPLTSYKASFNSSKVISLESNPVNSWNDCLANS